MPKLETIAQKMTTAFASFVAYLPIVAGIITPMVYMLLAWYISWEVAALIFPFHEIWSGFWFPIYDASIAFSVFMVGAVISVVGLGLFLWALFEMAKRKREGFGLVTTGPYARVRHPQHLGILMFLLPFALTFKYISSYNMGMRPGDILSWSLMAFMLLAVADWEEFKVAREYGMLYDEYRNTTPFIMPIKTGWDFNAPDRFQQGQPLRYVVVFALFWSMISVVLFIFANLPLVFTRGGLLS